MVYEQQVAFPQPGFDDRAALGTVRRWSCRKQLLASSFVLVVSLVVCGLFVKSSMSHLANPYFFLSSIYAYKIVGLQLGFIAALVVPFLQIVIICCVLARVFESVALGLAALLFATFAITQTSAIWRGLDVTCGCFGAVDSSRVGFVSLAFVAALSGCCAIACLLTRTSGQLEALQLQDSES